MKKNNFKFLVLAFFLMAGSSAFAQFSAGFNLGIPTGNWSNGWGLGWGLDARYEAPIQDQLNWTASLGFNSFSGKNGISSATIVPVTGGIKYYFQKSNAGAYVGGDLGIYFWSYSGYSTNRVGLAPVLGYRANQFDFSFRYNAVADYSYAGLRVAYLFSGK